MSGRGWLRHRSGRRGGVHFHDHVPSSVEMLKLRELSLKEASAESGMSVSALKVAVHRGMIALRKALTKES